MTDERARAIEHAVLDLDTSSDITTLIDLLADRVAGAVD